MCLAALCTCRPPCICSSLAPAAQLHRLHHLLAKSSAVHIAKCYTDCACAAMQGLCHVYSSGSGATSGMLVLFIADMAFNFETVRFPILRILAAAVLLGVFTAAAIVRGLPARLSVLGGALTSLFPVLSLLPHLKSEKFEWWIPYMSLFTTFGFLLALPLYVYLKRLPGISC